MLRILAVKRAMLMLTAVAVFGLAMGAGFERPVTVNDKIAFMSYRDENWEIYIMDADGSNQTNLTNTPIDEMNPHFSPDGSEILFQSEGALYTMSPDGTNKQMLPTDQLHAFNGRFSWDGAKIVFSASSGKRLSFRKTCF